MRPLDIETIVESVKKTNRLSRSRKAGRNRASAPRSRRALMEQAFDWLDAPRARVTGKDVPMPYAANLEKLALPSCGRVVAAAKAVATDEPRWPRSWRSEPTAACRPIARIAAAQEILRAFIVDRSCLSVRAVSAAFEGSRDDLADFCSVLHLAAACARA